MIGTIQRALPYFLDGIKVTAMIAIISIAIGIFIGLFACLLKISNNKIAKAIAGAYIWVIRGTPMIVQAMLVYFGLPQILRLIPFMSNVRFTPFLAGVITLSLNAGAYIAEIFRGGIQAVPVGEVEAARSLGLTKSKTMIKIILPQAIKITIPSMLNQFIITVKDTSILTVIGLKEIVNKAGEYVSIRYDYFETYVWVAVFYLVIISVLMIVTNHIEKRLGNGKK